MERALQEEGMKRLAQAAGATQQEIKLRVGGVLFATTTATLEKHPHSFFALMLTGDAPVKQDSEVVPCAPHTAETSQHDREHTSLTGMALILM